MSYKRKGIKGPKRKKKRKKKETIRAFYLYLKSEMRFWEELSQDSTAGEL